MIKFYDTCSLLLAGESLFEGDKFVVSSITFNELERIKTATNKDPDVKYSARVLLHLFEQYPDSYDVVIHKTIYEEPLKGKAIEVTDDTRILMDANWYNNTVAVDDTIFVTNDLALKHIANLFFGNGDIESISDEPDDYTGYQEIIATNQELEEFYQNSMVNYFDLRPGEYLVLRNEEGEIIDLRCWTGEDHRFLKGDNFKTHWFGKVIPYSGDVYQKLLFDSLSNNILTVIRGPAGTGKSYIALAYLVQELEKGRIDNITIFCNTVATRDAAKLGYYPGTKDAKLLDSQIGNFLVSKFGGIDEVQRFIDSGKLTLIPVSDARGIDLKPHTGVYVTEAQNTSIDIMQLILQRIGEDCPCVVEGDDLSQVDMNVYAGSNNGLRKTSQVFRGEPYYGEVTLKNCYRSRIAKRAELFKLK